VAFTWRPLATVASMGFSTACRVKGRGRRAARGAVPLLALLALLGPASAVHRSKLERAATPALGQDSSVRAASGRGSSLLFFGLDAGVGGIPPRRGDDHDVLRPYAKHSSHWEYLVASVILFALLLVSCCLLQFGGCKQCTALIEERCRELRDPGTTFCGVSVLVVYGEDAREIAERLAKTLHDELGCKVSGAPALPHEAHWGGSCAEMLREGIEAVIVVLSPRIFESEACRQQLSDICMSMQSVPIVPVYAGSCHAKDDLKQLYKSKIALDLGEDEKAALEVVRRQVFAENMADIDNHHHKERSKDTLRAIVRRFESERNPSALQAAFQRVADLFLSCTRLALGSHDKYHHDVFISYSTADNRQTFENMRACFLDLGCNVFNPTVDMQGAKVSLEVMQAHVRGSKVLVLMPGLGHCKSPWCRGELLAGIEARTPIVRVFAGQAMTEAQLLSYRNEDPEKLAGSSENKVVEETAIVRDFAFRQPMFDVRNEDHSEECVRVARRVAFEHLPWLRRRWVCRRIVKALVLPILLGLAILALSVRTAGSMQRCCQQQHAQCLRRNLWLAERLPFANIAHEDQLASMRKCLTEIQVIQSIDEFVHNVDGELGVRRSYEGLKSVIRENRHDRQVLQEALVALRDVATVDMTKFVHDPEMFALLVDVVQVWGRKGATNLLVSALDSLVLIAEGRTSERGPLTDALLPLIAEILGHSEGQWRIVRGALKLLESAGVRDVRAFARADGAGDSLLAQLRSILEAYAWNEGIEYDALSLLSSMMTSKESADDLCQRGVCQSVLRVLATSAGHELVLRAAMDWFGAYAALAGPGAGLCHGSDERGLVGVVDALRKVAAAHTHGFSTALLASCMRVLHPPLGPLRSVCRGPTAAAFAHLVEQQAQRPAAADVAGPLVTARSLPSGGAAVGGPPDGEDMLE